MEQDNREIEDLIEDLEKSKEKKKVCGKSKGNRTELNLCKYLGKKFGDEFSKAPGSGARTSQVAYLPEHAKKTLTGDLCVPEGFKWVVECKGGYEDKVNLNNALDGKITQIDEWIEQTLKDSDYCGRLPIIFWKRNYKPWLVMLRTTDLPKNIKFEYKIKYRNWTIVNLDTLLEKTDRNFWYE